MKYYFALLGLASLASAAPVDVLEDRAACATGVHMIVARATSERPGEGIIGQVASMIKKAIPGSDSVAVNYPASLFNYQSSVTQGASAMKALIENYVAQCPNAKIALLGYSQGAQVSADVMCGSSSRRGSTSISSAIASKNIIAVIEMGDPSRVSSQPFNVGTSTRKGIFPRTNAASCQGAQFTQSYCDAGDSFCDSGINTAVHFGYVAEYGSQAAAFVVSKFKKA
ncbi:cutinase [Rhexocercosporidium sp. MPI-PUGE-AT-0058]|nr:cutinase [Rhexocercosporidium sp. MPI-PUGE-AT-0058]